ncbi:MAG: LemA family protein [Patescibacteria group bacterium]|nr:LemA family protein [Patescibacteria group bacterium]
MSILTIILIILGVVLLALIFMFNSLVRTKNRVEEAWNDIKIQLKRRFELIPDLMKSVQAAIKLDEKLLTQITKLRSQAGDLENGSPAERAKTENALGDALGALKIQVEAYPDIKSHTEISQFMSELTDTQDKIMASQRFYNGMVRDFNTKIQVFPTNLFAGMMGFKGYEFFEVPESEQKKPEVQLEV